MHNTFYNLGYDMGTALRMLIEQIKCNYIERKVRRKFGNCQRHSFVMFGLVAATYNKHNRSMTVGNLLYGRNFVRRHPWL